jgi:hypothetical protein
MMAVNQGAAAPENDPVQQLLGQNVWGHSGQFWFTLATVFVGAVYGLLTAFGVVSFSPDQKAAVMNVIMVSIAAVVGVQGVTQTWHRTTVIRHAPDIYRAHAEAAAGIAAANAAVGRQVRGAAAGQPPPYRRNPQYGTWYGDAGQAAADEYEQEQPQQMQHRQRVAQPAGGGNAQRQRAEARTRVAPARRARAAHPTAPAGHDPNAVG